MKSDYKKILIFGGNGFLGSHVVDELISKIDNFFKNLSNNLVKNLNNISKKFPYINFVIAPRHPERSNKITADDQHNAVKIANRSPKFMFI